MSNTIETPEAMALRLGEGVDPEAAGVLMSGCIVGIRSDRAAIVAALEDEADDIAWSPQTKNALRAFAARLRGDK